VVPKCVLESPLNSRAPPPLISKYSGTSVIRTPVNRLLGLSDVVAGSLVPRDSLGTRVASGYILINTQCTCWTKMASSSSTSSPRKRKRVVLTLESKLAILDRLKAGATQEQQLSALQI
jgi:hypothetical protein